MASVSRQGDSVLSPDGTGYKCRMPMQTSIAGANSSGVFANGIPIAVIGSAIAVHPKSGCLPDISFVSSGSGRVFIGGQPVARIGDSAGDNTLTQGSANVFVA
jgi:uncharacterized Zn-binding protein involved in type VI secretion